MATAHTGRKMCIDCAARVESVTKGRCGACYRRVYRHKQRVDAGIPENNRREWTPEDDMRLRFINGTAPMHQIAKELGRTPAAVLMRLKRIYDLPPSKAVVQSIGMTPQQVADALGVSRSAVFNWIHAGWLKKRRARAQGRSFYAIDTDMLIEFIDQVAGLFNTLNPDPDWREAVAYARVQLRRRYISSKELAALLHVSRVRFNQAHWVKRGFPLIALDLNNHGAYYDRSAVRAWLDQHPQYWTKAAREQL